MYTNVYLSFTIVWKKKSMRHFRYKFVTDFPMLDIGTIIYCKASIIIINEIHDLCKASSRLNLVWSSWYICRWNINYRFATFYPNWLSPFVLRASLTNYFNNISAETNGSIVAKLHTFGRCVIRKGEHANTLTIFWPDCHKCPFDVSLSSSFK